MLCSRLPLDHLAAYIFSLNLSSQYVAAKSVQEKKRILRTGEDMSGQLCVRDVGYTDRVTHTDTLIQPLYRHKARE